MREVAGDVGQRHLARDLADALLGLEHRAHAGGDGLLDELGDEVFQGRRRIVSGNPSSRSSSGGLRSAASSSAIYLSLRLRNWPRTGPARGATAWYPGRDGGAGALDGDACRSRRYRRARRRRAGSSRPAEAQARRQRLDHDGRRRHAPLPRARRRGGHRATAAHAAQLARLPDHVRGHRQLPVAQAARAVSRRGVDRARAAQHPSAQRAPHRARDLHAAGAVHQGRPADLDHDELPARGVPARARGAAGRGAAAALRRHRAPRRRRARRAARRAVRQLRAHADRVGVDRPGPPRADEGRHQGRGEGAVPRHPGGRAPRPAHAAPHLLDHRVVRAVPGPRRALPRGPRDRHGGARLPRRGEQREADRGQLRRPHRRRVPDRRRGAIDRARARHPLRVRRQDHRPRPDQGERPRPHPARAPGRRDLLPADLHRRRLSRRPAPGEPARPPGGTGQAADDRTSSTSARSPRFRPTCAPASSS